jgi:hypothetical protein
MGTKRVYFYSFVPQNESSVENVYGAFGKKVISFRTDPEGMNFQVVKLRMKIYKPREIRAAA